MTMMTNLFPLITRAGLLLLLLGCTAAWAGAASPAFAESSSPRWEGSGPVPNPSLASPLYAITHFDNAQSDSTPYGPPAGTFPIDPIAQPVVCGGPINIMTFASPDKDYLWVVGTSHVGYVSIADGNFFLLASYEALAESTGGILAPIPEENFRSFGKASAVGMNVSVMNETLSELFGPHYDARFKNGFYSVVDNENVLYSDFGGDLYAFTLTDPADPAAGITRRSVIRDVITTIQGEEYPAGTRLFGLSMTYDGHLIITFSNGIAVIDRNLDPATASLYRFGEGEFLTNAPAVDEKNGIYVASDSIMRKIVWDGTTLSDDEADGAWSCPYPQSEQPPIIKVGAGTGSSPTLMGFGEDADRLVVLTDGARQMNLLAFWRDDIPEGSPRLAGSIPVTCGFEPLPDWIQSEQSVVVSGYGAFVVNNIPANISGELVNQNKILQVSLMGPAYETSYGVERFEWDPVADAWSSVWARPDVSSTSMVPIHSSSAGMALINGYRSPGGWEVLGLDWETGETVHQTVFGDMNFGNGAYAILQYLEDGSLLFNSFMGPMRIDYPSA